MFPKFKNKILSSGKSSYKEHLKRFLPLYDIKNNCVCIPDTLINQFLKGQASDIKGLNSAYFSSKQDFCLINLSVRKLLNNIDIELKLIAESFNINQSEANIILKCDEDANIQGKNWIGKATALMAKTLLQFLVIKNPHEKKMNLSDVSVDINWPEIRFDLSTYEPYRKLKQKQLLGINIFDIISFKDLLFEPGKCNVRVIPNFT